VAAREPGVPVIRVRTLQSYVDDALSSSRALGALSIVFGGVAALLAALGVFGVLSLMVGRRRAEIGLRMAVGASPAQVRRMIARRGMALTAWGTVLGLGAAFAASRALGSLLFQVRPADPAVYGAVILFMAMLALAASLLPAFRASRTDPARILEEGC
jgi:ABC-type antimicrobial peptide transport system permease subunit